LQFGRRPAMVEPPIPYGDHDDIPSTLSLLLSGAKDVIWGPGQSMTQPTNTEVGLTGLRGVSGTCRPVTCSDFT
jgi:hypothetical protein